MPMKFNDFTVCFYCIRSTVVGEEVSDGCVLHIVMISITNNVLKPQGLPLLAEKEYNVVVVPSCDGICVHLYTCTMMSGVCFARGDVTKGYGLAEIFHNGVWLYYGLVINGHTMLQCHCIDVTTIFIWTLQCLWPRWSYWCLRPFIWTNSYGLTLLCLLMYHNNNLMGFTVLMT